ncbi:MAG: hypothetical protein IJ756_08655 [Paludibacteraceae bacterium]|nr:hypothetical protein [Paludibacteraceae bacterium]
MLDKKTLLFTAIAAILFTSCNPSVIEENDAKFLAACAGQPRWVASELYDYVIETYQKSISYGNGEELGDLVFEEGDDMWNLQVFNEKEDGLGDAITELDLYNFIHDGEMPVSNVDEYSALLAHLYFGTGNGYNKKNAFKTACEVCNGNFQPLLKKICGAVEVYDYRENEQESSKRVTVYDVVYKVNDKRYVYCTIHDLNDGTFETNYVKDAELFSNLGF